jgi:LPXTG-motif cell wall-anchored protein
MASNGNGQWLAFFALAALLIIGIVVTLRRRNKG